MSEINTINYCGVTVSHDNIIIMFPRTILTKEQALVFAAYLVTFADEHDNFPKYLEAVKNT